jgi:hypothetical protein
VFEGNVDEVDAADRLRGHAARSAPLGRVGLASTRPRGCLAVGAAPQLKVVEGAEMRVQYLAFDLQRDELIYGSEKKKNPFKDLRVRQAVAHAIDADAIKVKVMRGHSKPNGALITDQVAGYHKDGDKRVPYDRERAKKLLAEAGYPAGFEVTLDCGNNQPASDICQAVARCSPRSASARGPTSSCSRASSPSSRIRHQLLPAVVGRRGHFGCALYAQRPAAQRGAKGKVTSTWDAGPMRRWTS